jgi:ABC-type phosphate/phosphonate transport system substrate-binding protein
MVVLALGLPSRAANAQELVLAINEGVTYQDGGPAGERYRPLIQMLSKELKQNIRLMTVDKYSAFEKGLADGKYDLVFIHPAQVGLQAVKRDGYVGLATAKGYTDYRARVMVAKNSPLKTLQDLRGKKIGVPAVESITTTMFTAALRELGFPHPEDAYTATRYQDAVPFMVENGFVDAGVTGSGKVAQAWATKGGRILAETKPIPIKQFLASGKMSDADREKVRTLLLGLSETEAGKATLAKIGMTGFVPWNTAVMNEAAARLGI